MPLVRFEDVDDGIKCHCWGLLACANSNCVMNSSAWQLAIHDSITAPKWLSDLEVSLAELRNCKSSLFHKISAVALSQQINKKIHYLLSLFAVWRKSDTFADNKQLDCMIHWTIVKKRPATYWYLSHFHSCCLACVCVCVCVCWVSYNSFYGRFEAAFIHVSLEIEVKSLKGNNNNNNQSAWSDPFTTFTVWILIDDRRQPEISRLAGLLVVSNLQVFLFTNGNSCLLLCNLLNRNCRISANGK